MALSNLFGWKKAETKASAACGTACGALDKPEENRQHAEQRVEHQTSRRRNRQHAGQHVEHLTSKVS